VTPFYVTSVGSVSEDILTAIETAVWHVFGFETRRVEALPEPLYALDPQRQQFASVLILRELLNRCPVDAARLLAITERDLFIPMLSFVFGQAQLQGRVALVSLARLRQEYYALPANPALLLARALKETIHETGHTFGLVHCMDKRCPMSLSHTIQQVDSKSAELCTSCTIVLQDHIRITRTQIAASGKE